MKNKICSKCERDLPLTNDYFEKRKESRDGFRGVCRECRGGKYLNQIKIDRYNEVKEFIEHNSNCELIDTVFVNVDTKMSFKCDCGKIFETTFYKFKNKNKRQCNDCSGQSEWDFNRINEWMRFNTDCVLLRVIGRDENYSPIIEIKCSCGDIFQTDFRSFRKKISKCCNNCSEYKYYDINYVKNYVECNSKCVLLSESYDNIYGKLEFICQCGEKFITTFSNFMKQNKRHCDKCGIERASAKKSYTFEEVKHYIENNSTCKLVSKEYSGCYDKLELLCECGERFFVSFDKFKNQGVNNKVRCDICNKRMSLPVRNIKDFLIANNINFEREYVFKDCRYKKCLPFDFYLPDKNICIEYDGEFHYKELSIGNDLELQKTRDRIKTNYCVENNIKLIRIPYWENNKIEDILEKELA